MTRLVVRPCPVVTVLKKKTKPNKRKKILEDNRRTVAETNDQRGNPLNRPLKKKNKKQKTKAER